MVDLMPYFMTQPMSQHAAGITSHISDMRTPDVNSILISGSTIIETSPQSITFPRDECGVICHDARRGSMHLKFLH